MDLRLDRVSDPRFMAVEMPIEPARTRRLIARADASLDELHAQATLELGERARVLREFEVEADWRTTHRTPSEPRVTYGSGARADILARADASWRHSIPAPPTALVHVMLDASGADTDFIAWLLGDDAIAYLYLVTPVATAAHLPASFEHRGQRVELRAFAWTRDPVDKYFDPLAVQVWFDLGGPNLALRRRVIAPEPVTFKPH